MAINPKFFASLLLISNISFAATVAVIDSGVDLRHPEFQGKIWENPSEVENGVDSDQNGYIDDIHGWNFTANNNQLINYKYLPLVHDEDIKHVMEIEKKLQLSGTPDTLPAEDMLWIKEALERRPDLLEKFGTYGSFSHGTHVAGIAAKGNKDIQIMPIKYLPTDMNDVADQVADEAKTARRDKGFKSWLAEKLIKSVIKTMQEDKIKLGKYLSFHKVDVANGSYGTGYPQAQAAARSLLDRLAIFKKTKDKDVNKVAKTMLNAMKKEELKYVDAAKGTLLVYASGNDGLDNDKYPSSSNINRDNFISVAATNGFKSLASFSNYGKNTVDIAAPGVDIKSSIPDGIYAEMSGTSQAAPYVTNVASQMKDANRNLTPKQLKQILMETGTVKSFLKGKVKSSAIVNKERAIRAAELSKTMSIKEAINNSK